MFPHRMDLEDPRTRAVDTATSTAALLLTCDDALLDDTLRLAAAAGAPVDVAHDPATALRSWSAAPVVLVGADQAEVLAEYQPPRRDEVHLLAHGNAPQGLYRAALRIGAHDVVELPAADAWLVELLTDAVEGAGSGAWTVGVLPGSGGAGASTFAAAVAVTAAEQAPTLLCDLDPWGPGLDRVLGMDEADGARWDALAGVTGRLGSRSLRQALPERDGLAVLTWSAGAPVSPGDRTVREVLAAAQRGSDVVVVDLPRSIEQTAADVVARCDLVLLLAQGSVPAVAAAAKVAGRLRALHQHTGLVVRGAPGALPAAGVADALSLPLLAEYPSRRRVPEQVDLGVGPVRSRRSPLARAARAVLDSATRQVGRLP
jgi:secretion/DNA translocation related CpaE-like protein